MSNFELITSFFQNFHWNDDNVIIDIIVVNKKTQTLILLTLFVMLFEIYIL